MTKLTKQNSESGQAIIILVMIMVITLAIGLGVVTRSVTSLSNSSKTEESSRAYSASQAGLEQAIEVTENGGTYSTTTLDLGNQASALTYVSPALPDVGQALEYPPIGKDTNAQFWLINPDTTPVGDYPQADPVYFYFGNPDPKPGAVKPAVELSFISQSIGGGYEVTKYFYDSDSSRRLNNGFSTPLSCDDDASNTVDTSNQSGSVFYCRLPGLFFIGQPIMIRARILYSDTPQKLALSPSSGGASLPALAHIYSSVGMSGTSQQKLQEFRQPYVVPPYFDFAIFSASDLSK